MALSALSTACLMATGLTQLYSVEPITGDERSPESEIEHSCNQVLSRCIN